MIRFGVVLAVVVVAIGLLVGGIFTSSLLLVYLAIGVSALAAVLLTIGVVVWRDEIFGDAGSARAARQADAAMALDELSSRRRPARWDAAAAGDAAVADTFSRGDVAARPAPAMPVPSHLAGTASPAATASPPDDARRRPEQVPARGPHAPHIPPAIPRRRPCQPRAARLPLAPRGPRPAPRGPRPATFPPPR